MRCVTRTLRTGDYTRNAYYDFSPLIYFLCGHCHRYVMRAPCRVVPCRTFSCKVRNVTLHV